MLHLIPYYVFVSTSFNNETFFFLSLHKVMTDLPLLMRVCAFQQKYLDAAFLLMCRPIGKVHLDLEVSVFRLRFV